MTVKESMRRAVRALQLAKEAECRECRGTCVGRQSLLCPRCRGVGVDPEHPRFLDAVEGRMMESGRWFKHREILARLVEKCYRETGTAIDVEQFLFEEEQREP